jgi:hypothetical protein
MGHRTREKGGEMDQPPLGSYEDEQRRAAMTRSYLTPAIITMVLYLVLWLPGLIANIIYWQSASRDQRLSGHSPEGKGCLLALFVVFGALPLLLACVGFLLFAVFGTFSTATSVR